GFTTNAPITERRREAPNRPQVSTRREHAHDANALCRLCLQPEHHAQILAAARNRGPIDGGRKFTRLDVEVAAGVGAVAAAEAVNRRFRAGVWIDLENRAVVARIAAVDSRAVKLPICLVPWRHRRMSCRKGPSCNRAAF